MRRCLVAVILSLLISSNVGCILPAYSGDPARRTQQMIYTSEDLRALMDQWERFWFLDQPNPLTPIRTHGGII